MAFVLCGCAGRQTPAPMARPEVPPPYPMHSPPREAPDSKAAVPEPKVESKADNSQSEQRARFLPTPPAPVLTEKTSTSQPETMKYPDGAKITVNFEGLPLEAFVNAVYGDVLKTPFEIDSALRGKKDLVSLRAPEPMSLSQVDALARQVLSNYGVTVHRQGAVLRFFAPKPGTTGQPPLLVSGRTLPEVPISHRPVFQLVPLKVVRNGSMRNWLQQAYKGQQLEVFEDPELNAVLLMGPPEIVQQALEAVNLLDKPNMRGSHSMRIEPVYLAADELGTLLVEVLGTEGYAAGLKTVGSTVVLPIHSVNAVLVFAADETTLEHVRQWVVMLDRPGKEVDKEGVFYYQVQNTGAADLGSVLGRILSGMTQNVARQQSAAESSQPQSRTQGGRAQSEPSAPQSQNIVVDQSRNGLIFKGDVRDWQKLLPIVREMDRPARMVLIEVTVVEITLTKDENLGVEWILRNLKIGDFATNVGTLGGLDIARKGLTFTLDNAGQTWAVINAFASKDRVRILSCPRVMVKSGSEASIDVGTEVPTITSQSTAADLTTGTTPSILQQIQYRKTGVLLKVKPTIHSGNRVDLDISQEVSESQPGSAAIPSPNIFTRKIETTLGLGDGGSVLLGGLISSKKTNNTSNVPGLTQVPLLGRLFRVDSNTDTRTELMMLIAPYIVNNQEEASKITESFQRTLNSVNSLPAAQGGSRP